MSITVPDRPSEHLGGVEAAGSSVGRQPPRAPEDLAPADPGRPAALRIGRLDLGPVAAYLLVWSGVVFAVSVLVLWSGHTALDRAGVLESVSRAAATVFGEPEPDGGVLPVLEWSALLPWALAVAAALAVLWLVASLSLVLVHNGICALLGGPRVHVR